MKFKSRLRSKRKGRPPASALRLCDRRVDRRRRQACRGPMADDELRLSGCDRSHTAATKRRVRCASAAKEDMPKSFQGLRAA